jgi:hypothetical protein
MSPVADFVAKVGGLAGESASLIFWIYDFAMLLACWRW